MNKFLNMVFSMIMAIAMVLGLCGLNVDTVKVNAATDPFEESIKNFPQSYKNYLRGLHSKYPNWKFEMYNTGIDFSQAVDNEYKNNRSLIENTYSKFLKSNEPGDYDASKGTYIAKDGGRWVSSSKNAIAYFMDPRNFLNAKHVYMFEKLSYDSVNQTQVGVEAILEGSFMHDNEIGYLTSAGKYKTTNIKYSSQILSAAQESNVSAYYIASKIVQEIGMSKHSKYAGMGAGGSVNGEYGKYKGIYNFYNIGAYSSANPIANGLAWAGSGKTYKRPWDTPMKSINGGAIYIGEKYINCGQNTIYYQRFNVNKASRYGLYEHQYMTNVYGAAAEAAIASSAYENMGIAHLTKTFVVPVYNNMPDEKATVTLGNATKSGEIISAVNVRKGPATSYKKVVTLAKGDKVTVSKGVMTTADFGSSWLSNPYWYYVTLTKNGKKYTGYIAATYVTTVSEKEIPKDSKVKLPVKVSSGKVYYMSDNPAIATVDANGNITGKKEGLVTVRAFTQCSSMGTMTVQIGNSNKPQVPVVSGISKKYNAIKLKWNVEAGVSRYYIYKKQTNKKYKLLKIVKGNVHSFTDRKLITGQAYYYKVKACKIVKGTKYKSAKSKAVKVIPIPQTPKKPVIKSTKTGAQVSWNKIKGSTGYVIYKKSAKKEKYKKYKTVTKKVTSINEILIKNKIYYYKVVAYRKVSNKIVYGKRSTASYIKK